MDPTEPDEQLLFIAECAHEANRVYCESLGDFSQACWKDAPDWQKASAIDGVRFHLAHPDAEASASHVNWMSDKERDGWQWGPEKDPDKKRHPCMVPFSDLPIDQQIKDHVFRTVVHFKARMIGIEK